MRDKNNEIPLLTRRESIIIICLACVNIAAFGILAHFTSIPPILISVIAALMFLTEVSVLSIKRAQVQKQLPVSSIYDMLKERCSIVVKNAKSPYAAFDSYGTLLWCNQAMMNIIDTEENPIGQNISDIFSDSISPENFGLKPIEIDGRIYSAESFNVPTGTEDKIYLLSLNDITELLQLEKKYNDNRVCVAYIAIDNIEDVLQYVQEKFRIAVSQVDEKLKSWAESINAIIKTYDNDKYIMLLSSKVLDECLDNRFKILDDIRQIRVGDGVSITISMGVARSDGSLQDSELAARDAIDLALQRGGDQVVYYNEGVTEYYGGRTKSIYKRSNVRSRTFTNQLMALMARSDNVLVMGHRSGDFDSFGASIGIAKIAMLCGVKVNIAVELRDKNLEPCIAVMQQTDTYSQVFVDNADGLDLVNSDTLVVLVDHNAVGRAQFSDISSKAKKIAIVDHHRKTDSFSDTVEIYYIEPSASSTCELVTEMLESAVSSQNLIKEEADMLLAGILLDTKQFTRNTGTRTFGSAQYLRGAGANPTDVYALFKTAADDLKKESRFHTSITIYREHIAISCCDGENDESYRVIASKAADKMLTLRAIEAAFTVVRIGEQIHISGRSNGNINVQLILEKMHGGGHFDVAGAQINGESVLNVLETLKSSIDDYLDAL